MLLQMVLDQLALKGVSGGAQVLLGGQFGVRLRPQRRRLAGRLG